jgi:hypothetical protein
MPCHGPDEAPRASATSAPGEPTRGSAVAPPAAARLDAWRRVAGRGARPVLAADALALQRSAGNRVVARRLAPKRAAKRVLARQDSAQDLMMGMMWEQMGREIEGIITGLFGGRAWVSPAQNRVEYSGPRGGVGGVTGGVVRAVTIRLVPIEEDPTATSLMGMEVGAGLVPVFDPAERLVTGESVTGLEASRGWAAVQLVVDVLPFALEARAGYLEARTASVLASSEHTVSLAFRAGRPIGHNMVAINGEWSHLVVADATGIGVRTTSRGARAPVIVTGGEAWVSPVTGAPGPEYVVITVPVTEAQAEAARAVATARGGFDIYGQQVGKYRLLTTDCTTYAREVLGAAGVRTPPLSTPAVNAGAVWLQSPASIPVMRAGSFGAAATAAGVRTTELEERLQMSLPAEHLQSQP